MVYSCWLTVPNLMPNLRFVLVLIWFVKWALFFDLLHVPSFVCQQRGGVRSEQVKHGAKDCAYVTVVEVLRDRGFLKFETVKKRAIF